MSGLIGRKIGMAQLFDEEDGFTSITVVEGGPCPILQVKEAIGTNRYSALQLGFGQRKHSTKAMQGHAQKAKLSFVPQILREFHMKKTGEWNQGELLTVSIFKSGDLVKITGMSKGKGTAGVVKRHHFAGGPKSHGQTDRHRHAGAIGTTSTPGHVLKGKRMAGRMGRDQVTVKNLKVVRVDEGKNLLYLRGAIPGPANGIVLIEK